ncbi:linear amide C-N hydrolase [Bordetella genomosp. 12]|uniref:Linear amide C-N hydrolase n=1 Tax=Bordetella genomosp. 12 TaxID=463035 RepID=A0A261VMV0_9BORD|nr:linear amide C-N hydrolase [Bordetella genomosp. 12]OZI74533.1 linear amide C-N hydrolase [Bordetella genomosp. 12]
MNLKATLQRTVVATALAMLVPSLGQACTSLLYTDGKGASYAGRTLELAMELPYQVAYFPVSTSFGSKADNHHVLDFKTKNAFVSIGVPDPVNGQFKALQGVNDKGLTFSLLAFPNADGPANAASQTTAVLAAIDLGTWTLSQFNTVAEVKAALEKQPVLVTSLLPKGQLKTPFHYALHDASGKSIVIEYSGGAQHVYDNPVGVMTNGPTFPWHMTNLDNYSFLSNKDQSSWQINGKTFQQPDTGIATAGLPASNTSVGRFVRAVYYSHFAEKVDSPDKALLTLAHIMNNFDRPRGITVDKSETQSIAGIPVPPVAGEPGYSSEYTSWTTLTDLNKHQMLVRTYANMNYVRFDLNTLAQSKAVKQVPLASISADVTDGSKVLLAAK